MRRIFSTAMASVVFMVGPAVALDQREAEAVVTVLETLAYERGEPVYMDAAADWLEFDQDRFGLIAEAGFSPESWTRAYDETLLGFAGGIEEAEINAQIAQAEAGVAASPLTDEQKQAVLTEFLSQMDMVRQAIQDGQQFTGAVAPVRERLRVLMEEI